MPYILQKNNNGYKVCLKNNKTKCFSNKPITKEKAIKQKNLLNRSDMFEIWLTKNGINPNEYLKKAKELAKKTGYNPNNLRFSHNGIHKLVYNHNNKLIRFGRVGYGDYIIWSIYERGGLVPIGYSNKKRRTFRKSHKEITKKFGLNKYTPNELAINVIW